MTNIDTEARVRDVVIAHPNLARELEHRNLDYCCHGDQTLADACRVAGLDPAVVVEELRAVTGSNGPERWTELDPASLAEHIERLHHRYLWDELPRLHALLEKVVAVHGTRHPELDRVALTFAALRADLEPHLVKEERVLFPMIRELTEATTRPAFHCGRIANPISMMTLEHERAGEILEELRVVTDQYRVPADGCSSFRALYEGLARLEANTHLHIHKENNVLFPAVTRLEEQFPDATVEVRAR